MTADPSEPSHVHRLPPAPFFVGREAELDALRTAWMAGGATIALVGLGGAGKTALAARFLEEVAAGSAPPRPQRLFIWSFYQEPDAGRFLHEAYRFFAPERASTTPAKGSALLHLLREALTGDEPRLLVLDGLERVQRPEPAGGRHGQIEDPLLRALLTRLAEGTGKTMTLVTSRFPLSDLEPYAKRGYHHLRVGPLDTPSASALLRQRGVQGPEAALADLVAKYGGHALTLDHLGGLIGQFLQGDPSRAPEAPSLENACTDRQALRLARLLRAYETHLPPAELALLCRLSLLRRTVTAPQIAELFLCSPAVNARTIREVADLLKRYPGLDKYFFGTLAENLAAAVESTLEELRAEAPLAGPDESFRREVCALAQSIIEFEASATADTFAELVHHYDAHLFGAPTDERPLTTDDRRALADNYTRYKKLSDELTSHYQQSKTALWLRPEPVKGDMGSLLRRSRRTHGMVRYLVDKHLVLRRLRELCRLRQRKWATAGPLAFLDHTGLEQTLESLCSRHLVVRESDSSYSIHPAIRDHFARIGDAAEQGTWHDLLREQLTSLARRPGRGRPDDPATLDLV